MLRMRSLVVIAVLMATIIFGSTLASAGWGWWWNAQLDVEGTEVHTEWTVTDDQDNTVDGEADRFRALIKITLPDGADAALVAQADTETVVLQYSSSLECKVDGIEAEIETKVTALGQVAGMKVAVVVTADGQDVDSVTGHLNESLNQQVLIPTNGVPSCASQ